MSTIPPLARLATKALAEATRAAPSPSAAEEERTIDAIARAIAARAARENRRRRMFVIACVAAGVVAVIGGVGLSQRTRDARPTVAASTPTISATGHALAGPAMLLHDGQPTALDGVGVVAGDHLIAPAEARASLDLLTGTHFVIESSSDFGVVDLGAAQRFVLRSGAVRADVAKLKPGQRFVVATSDTEVEVKGTSFRVSVVAPTACGGGTATRVSVTEGVVVVRSAGVESRVPAGHEWPEGCDARAAASPPSEPAGAPASVPTESPAAVPPSAPSAEPPRTLRPASPSEAPRVPLATSSTSVAAQGATAPEPGRRAATTSEIAEQNRLFAEASSAKRRGASSEAIVRYESFLARYPSSQLAESAMVERMRLLAATQRASGAAAAREYLNRFPSGFARQEAVALSAANP